MRFVLAAIAAIATLPGQDFLDLPWRANEAGQLEVQQPLLGFAMAKPQFGEWMPMFPSLFERDEFTGVPLLPQLLEHDAIAWLPLLVHGPGGAAALDESELRLKKLGLGVMTNRGAILDIEPDPLVDLLRVRHLASIELGATTWALRQFCRDEKRDAFVRAAAAHALLVRRSADDYDRDGARDVLPVRGGAAMLHAALERMPDRVDLVVGAHTAALPETAAAMVAWRTSRMRWTSSADMATGGSLSPAACTEGQLSSDRPGQLPYELAARFGNFRVDTVLVALRAEQGQWWIRLGGAFQPEKVAEGIREHGGAAVATEGVVHANLLDWELRVAADHLEVWPQGMQISSRGAWLPKLQQNTGPSAPPVWAHVPETSGFAARLGVQGCRVDVSFQPWRLRADVTCAERARAEALLTAWKAWQEQHGVDLDAGVPECEGRTWRDVAATPVGLGEAEVNELRLRQFVDAVVAQQHEARVAFTLDLAPLPAIDRVRLLSACQLRSLREPR